MELYELLPWSISGVPLWLDFFSCFIHNFVSAPVSCETPHDPVQHGGRRSPLTGPSIYLTQLMKAAVNSRNNSHIRQVALAISSPGWYSYVVGGLTKAGHLHQ